MSYGVCFIPEEERKEKNKRRNKEPLQAKC